MNSPEPGPVYPSPPRYVVSPPAKRRPYVTYSLMGISIVLFALQLAGEAFLGADYVGALGMKYNEFILHGEWWRLITPMFLHGSILHIGFNMYALNALGPNLERTYGRWRYLALYMISGFAGNVISFWFSPYPSLGASTAIFGLLGAEAVLLYHNREIFGAAAQRALTNIIVIAAINLVIGMSPGIDNWGHIGGLVGGVLFAWFGGPVFSVQPDLYTARLVDQREDGEAWRAGLSVTGLFILLTALKIFLSP